MKTLINGSHNTVSSFKLPSLPYHCDIITWKLSTIFFAHTLKETVKEDITFNVNNLFFNTILCYIFK